MIRINLLPHREQARKDRRQQFISLAVLMVIAGGLIWFLGNILIGQRIDTQVSSNEFLKSEIASLDKEIAEIARLKEQTQSLLARKQVIESLQGNRTQTVMVFNELVRQMPEGVFLKSVKQTGGGINFTGYAQSNARVSQLMRNLDASPIFEKPLLQEIKAVSYNRRQVGEFNLNVSIEKPTVEEPAVKVGPATASAPAGGKP
ncbi:type 4a pilus biogenesis protein PilN [Uliginosibacterium flavum]|uniref:PilN domain-containing protein n=1 Tax=Uliginosibacterium flavum TaxID=1396831 RepID=A0ABV2TK22_9RHOO